jgi:hypothetical protein
VNRAGCEGLEMVRVVLLKAVVVALFLMLLGTEHASAHSWYPDRCCNGHDCRKVTRLTTSQMAAWSCMLDQCAYSFPAISFKECRKMATRMSAQFRLRLTLTCRSVCSCQGSYDGCWSPRARLLKEATRRAADDGNCKSCF